jgi:hypothetical protein
MIDCLKKWAKDLWYDSTNHHLDNGRVIATISIATLIASTIWNMHLGKEINLAELGTGLTAILGGLQFYVYHDRKTNGTE